MFRSAMAKLEVDINKMPLGGISKTQIQKGFGVLSEIDNALRSSASRETLSVSASMCACCFVSGLALVPSTNTHTHTHTHADSGHSPL